MGLIRDYIKNVRDKENISNKETLELLLKTGGNFDEGILQKISQQTGVSPDVLKGIATGREIKPNIANAPEDVAAGNAVNPRESISAQEYDKRFGAGGTDVGNYIMPSAEERATSAKVATIKETAQPEAEAGYLKEKAINPAIIKRAGGVKSAETKAGITAQATPEVMAAKKKLYNEEFAQYSQKVALDLDNAKKLKMAAINPDEKRKIDAEIKHLENVDKHNKAMELIYGKEPTVVPAKMTDILNSLVASGFATKDSKTGIHLNEYAPGSVEEQAIEHTFKMSGIPYDKRTVSGGWFGLGSDVTKFSVGVQPTVKGGSKGVKKVESSGETNQPATEPVVKGGKDIFTTPEYKAWEGKFLKANPNASKTDARTFYKKKMGK